MSQAPLYYLLIDERLL